MPKFLSETMLHNENVDGHPQTVAGAWMKANK